MTDEFTQLVKALWPNLIQEIRMRGAVKPAPKENQMIPFLRKYAIEIVAAIGYITTIATALGLQHQHYVSVVLGVLSTVAVVLTKFFTVTKPAKAASAAGNSRPAHS